MTDVPATEEVVCEADGCDVFINPFEQTHIFEAQLCDFHIEEAYAEHEADLMREDAE